MNKSSLITTCVLSLLIFFTTQKASAQIALVIFPDSLMGFPDEDTVNVTDTLNFHFLLYNPSPTDSFSGPVTIWRRVNGFTDSLRQYPVLNIPKQTAISLVVSDSVDANRYGGGVNVVVIWPTTTVLGDTVVTSVYVLPITAVQAPLTPLDWELYPNPSRDMIYFDCGFSPMSVSRTEVVSMEGRVVQQHIGLPFSLSMEGMNPGIYFMRITFNDGQTRIRKFILQ